MKDTTKPDALRLADHLERFRSFPDDLAAAAELRRLHTENEATDRQVFILTDELSKCSKENAKLRALLSDLVKVCEHHDQSIADLLGRPVGWRDTYLDKARAALAQGEKT